EVARDGAGLRRRLDDHEWLGHVRNPRVNGYERANRGKSALPSCHERGTRVKHSLLIFPARNGSEPYNYPYGAMDPKDLIETFGTLGLLFIIFAESGLLLGLVFPGDSLLFTAGLLASQGKLNIAAVVLGCFVAAVAGAEVGYLLGRRFGPRSEERRGGKEGITRWGRLHKNETRSRTNIASC